MSSSDPHSAAESAGGWPSARGDDFDPENAWGWTVRERQVRPKDMAVGLLTTVAVAILGLPVGALWAAVAPAFLGYAQGTAVFLVDPESSAPIARDGVFALVSLIAGVLCGLVAYALLRGYGPATACGLVVGSVLAAVVAWQLGRHVFGPTDLTRLSPRPADGVRFTLPLDIGAQGVLLAWPIGAALTYFLFATVAQVTKRAARRGAADDDVAGPRGATRYLPTADQPPPSH